MATQTDGPRKSFKSTNDLSAKQYFIVKQDTDANAVILASAATDFIIGTLENKPKAGENASVLMRHGGATGKVKLGAGGCSVGSNLTSDASGTAIVTTTAADEVLGRALQAGVEGDIVEYVPCTHKYAVT